jgi:hypothetical protein
MSTKFNSNPLQTLFNAPKKTNILSQDFLFRSDLDSKFLQRIAPSPTYGASKSRLIVVQGC